MNLHQIRLHAITPSEEARFRALLDVHHYLGALPKIGNTLWYVVTWHGQWIALLSFSAAAWKCAARDQWIGWGFRYQFDRLHLVANNSRFLILPGHHYPNLASRILSLCERQLTQDWPKRFGHPLWLLETFVDPRHFHGTIYRAANWVYAGDTRGFRRTREGYSAAAQAPKWVFVRPLVRHAQARLAQPILDSRYQHGATKLMLSAEHMRSLPAFFADIPARVDLRAGSILCQRCWQSPLPLSCVGRVATRRLVNGPETWAKRPVLTLTATIAMAATRFRVAPVSAMY